MPEYLCGPIVLMNSYVDERDLPLFEKQMARLGNNIDLFSEWFSTVSDTIDKVIFKRVDLANRLEVFAYLDQWIYFWLHG